MKKILFALMLALFAAPGALFAGDLPQNRIENIHPHSHEKSVQVLCSKNQKTALDDAFGKSYRKPSLKIGSQKCEAGEKMLARHKAVARGIGIGVTPGFVTDTGAQIVGWHKYAMESYLKN